MNCPKCGYEQAERDDCVKCGVVFAKYIAMQKKGAAKRLTDPKGRAASSFPDRVIVPSPPPPKPRSAAVAAEPRPQEVPAAPQPATQPEPSVIVAQLRELGTKLNELEYERAERNRLRGELRVFDQKLEDRVKGLSDRLAAIEVRATPASEEAERAAILKRIVARLQGLEELRAAAAPVEAERSAAVVQIASRLERMEQARAAPPPGEAERSALLARIMTRLERLEEAQSAPAPEEAERTAVLGRITTRLERLEEAQSAPAPEEAERTAVLGRIMNRIEHLEEARSAPAPEEAERAAVLGRIMNRIEHLEETRSAPAPEEAERAAMLGRIMNRIEHLEETRSAPAAAPVEDAEKASALEQIVSRLELLEVVLAPGSRGPAASDPVEGSAAPPAASEAGPSETLAALSARLDEVESRTAAIPDDAVRGGGFATARELEEFVQELGTLQGRVDGLGDQLTPLGAIPAQIAELGAQVAAVGASASTRADVQAWRDPVQEMRAEFHAFARNRLEADQHVAPAIAAIEGEVGRISGGLASLIEEVGQLQAAVREISAHQSGFVRSESLEVLAASVVDPPANRALSTRVGEAEAQLSRLATELERVAAVEREVGRLSAVAAGMGKLGTLEARVSELAAADGALESAARDVAVRHQSQIDALQRERAGTAATLDRVLTRLAAVEERPAGENAAGVERLSAELLRLQGLPAAAAAVERELVQLRAGQAALSKVVKNLRDELTELKGISPQHGERINVLARVVAGLRESLEGETARSGELARGLGELRGTLDTRGGDRGTVSLPPEIGTRLEALAAQVSDLRNSIALPVREVELADIRKAQAAFSGALGAICSDLARLKESSGTWSPRIEALARDTEQLRASAGASGAEAGDLRKRSEELAGAVEEIRRELRERLSSPPAPTSPVPTADLEALRGSLQSVTLRYSEIGELKKNHLLLSTAVETLDRGLCALREAYSTNYFERVEDLSSEVQALRAEVRRILSS